MSHPDSLNRIIIEPERLQQTIEAMAEAGHADAFAAAFVRLLHLFSRYLSANAGPGREIIASMWPDHHSAHDFFWWIREEPSSPGTPGQTGTRLLAGGLNFHRQDGTWTINT